MPPSDASRFEKSGGLGAQATAWQGQEMKRGDRQSRLQKLSGADWFWIHAPRADCRAEQAAVQKFAGTLSFSPFRPLCSGPCGALSGPGAGLIVASGTGPVADSADSDHGSPDVLSDGRDPVRVPGPGPPGERLQNDADGGGRKASTILPCLQPSTPLERVPPTPGGGALPALGSRPEQIEET